MTRPWPGNRSRPRFVVAPRVFRASEGPATVCAGGRRPAREPSAPCVVACGSAGVPGVVGPGRPRDRHTRACGSEWSISKPARALRTLRRPPRQWGRVAGVWLGASAQSLARPRRRPPAPRQVPPPPTGTAAGPSGALHTSGAGCTDVWLGASARCPARPRRRPRALQYGPPAPPAPSTPVGPGVLTFVTSAAHWSSGQAPPPPTGTAVWPSGPSGSLHTGGAVSLECGWGRVVTNVVNPRCFLCGFLVRCYKRRQSEGFFADYGGFWAWIDDVCHRGLREAI